ncbi:MAG: Alkaline phosphatase synthesis transcriptional regulatory protein PhoP [Smithella sp. PtaU1.Bin162]|jgi:DNA-binding response OmpR family regulator|nr:MAG: Alkaline phosphatase synthesis transcriptional regulatory protein PhoP [Smithella sp. PtaU1.Bin162]
MKIRKILIVDDEQIILSYLEKKFTKLDYSVYLAGDGEEAVKQAFLNNPDIILLDIKLPKLNGIDVCKKLKADERTKNIPILILSARAQASEIKIGIAAGADKYLCKPMSFPDILSEIRAYDNK